ncbi:MAG: hypothetical protein JSU94_14575 [Phycisphaerales bacterium]|nr:MAG: hypothetical protein JSU94_14575 [Phycisphaerales bacterium]
MNAKGHCLIAAALVAVFCAAGLTDSGVFERESPLLISRPNPALAGIDELYVAMGYTEPNKDGLVWKDLRDKIEQKLIKAGIRMYSGNLRTWPVAKTSVLTVETRMLKLQDSQTCVFAVQLSLARPVYLEKEGGLCTWADVWKKSMRMLAVPAEEMPAAVTAAVLEDIETFVLAHRSANPPQHRPTPNDQSVTSPARPVVTDTSRPAGPANYVASKNSEVFHTPSCRSAKRIVAENIVTYETRQAAINSGKRPCKICAP